MFQSRLVHWAIAALLFLVVISPTFAFGQSIPTIVPENCRGANAAENCGVCDIGNLAQNVINTGIYVAVFLSAILFAWAGFQYMTAGGEPGKASQAKKVFLNVGVGLVLILGAWLIVDLIMKILVDGGNFSNFGPWNEIC